MILLCSIGAVALGVMGIMGAIKYKVHQINNSTELNGLDLAMAQGVENMTVMTIFKTKKDPDEFIDQTDKLFKKMRKDKKSIINRRIIKKKDGQFELKYQDKCNNSQNENKEQKIEVKEQSLQLIEKKAFDQEELEEFIQTPFVGKFNEDDPNFRITLDSNTDRFYVKTSHAFYDGWTFMKIASRIFADLDSIKYDTKIPKLDYSPVVSEYVLTRTITEFLLLDKPQLVKADDKSPYATQFVLHFQLTDQHLKIKTKKSHHYMSIYVHMMMKMFFDSYPDRDYYNVMVLTAIDNPNKLNNVSFVAFTVKKTDTIDKIDNKFKSRKHHTIATYFFINSSFSSGKKNESIDICFSSVPFFKQNRNVEVIGTILPHISCPIYIFNCKLGNTSISSVHFGTNKLDVGLFDLTLKKNDVTVHDKMQLNTIISGLMIISERGLWENPLLERKKQKEFVDNEYCPGYQSYQNEVPSLPGIIYTT